jgi:uncharacterized protein involved in type VI secretion and phage assembly
VPGEIKQYFGKYRGTVFNNVDLMNIGRIQAIVPDVLGAVPSTFAMPCLPFSGVQSGSWMIPSVGAGVWIEFEGGDPDFPIWSGTWFGTAAEVPAVALAAPPAVPNLVFQTIGQNTVMLSDVPGPTGGILIKSTTGALISVNDVGITISNGKGATIVMAGPTVSVNGTALVVT